MAQQIIVIDDLDGTELPAGTNATRLVIDGSAYELHLSEQNRASLDEALQPFLSTARKLKLEGSGRR